jgi:hypothetical protein
VAFARRRGWALRLVARLGVRDHAAEAWLAPTLVPERSALGQARDEQNVVVLDAGASGQVALAGPGAGSLPTAAAILADVRELVRSFPRGAAPLARPARRLPIVADDAARRHYVTLCGSSSRREAALQALAAVGVRVEVAESPWPGRLQLLTAAAPPSLVARALAGFETALVLAVREEDAAAETSGPAPPSASRTADAAA